MTNKTDFTFLSSDGKTRLHGIAWVPEDVTPVAVLQLRCFQRLSNPDSDTQRCAWRHN